MRCAAVLMALAMAGPAFAEDWFRVKTADAIAGIRRNVERLEAVAPLPEPKCGSRLVTTYCNAQVTRAVRFQIVETPLDRSQAGFAAFARGEPGGIVDVSVSYDPTIGTARDGAIADALCLATLLTFRPRLTPAAATRIYQTGMRRAVNATATGRGGIGRSIDGVGANSFMVEVDSLSIRCVMAARDQRHDHMEMR